MAASPTSARRNRGKAVVRAPRVRRPAGRDPVTRGSECGRGPSATRRQDRPGRRRCASRHRRRAAPIPRGHPRCRRSRARHGRGPRSRSRRSCALRAPGRLVPAAVSPPARARRAGRSAARSCGRTNRSSRSARRRAPARHAARGGRALPRARIASPDRRRPAVRCRQGSRRLMHSWRRRSGPVR